MATSVVINPTDVPTSGAPATLYTVPSLETSSLITLRVANQDSDPHYVTVFVDTDAHGHYLAYQAEVPGQGWLNVVDRESGPVFLGQNKVLKCYADAANQLTVCGSIVEMI